ncbi:melanoma-associated antigen B5-like [Sorex araneus]|uniref:melanoma-associated antigen B5-like n=1 Tax=Sorex araneus TaxID=42254 RepID=UPI000331583A|nr:melanoma-associated antigen B5-like [Sorex araneus]
MPRGHKHKRQVSGKRRQAGEEAPTSEGPTEVPSEIMAQATAAMAAAASVEAVVALDTAVAATTEGNVKAAAAEAKAEVAVAAAIVAAAAAVAAAEVAETATMIAGEGGAENVEAKPRSAKASTAPALGSRRVRGPRRRRNRPELVCAPMLESFQNAQPFFLASFAHEGPRMAFRSPAAERLGIFELPRHLTPDILASKAGMMEQFLMYRFKSKQLSLKRDMLDLIGLEYEEYFMDILKKASERIEVAFAVNVKEVDPVIHAYDLVGKIKLPNNGRLRAGKGLPKTGLLMNVLGMIVMKGNSAKEEDIWKFLSIMKVYPGRKHSIFGEPRKLITKDLVRLEYLEYRQIAGSDPPSYEFLWGPKAHAETTKRQVIDFLAKINERTTRTFLTQYEEALKDKTEF